MNIKLCSITDISDPGSKAFQIDNNGQPLDIFVVHKDGFINRYPHTGVNLEWLKINFLIATKPSSSAPLMMLYSKSTPAFCIHGPCTGDSLSPVDIEIIDNTLVAHL